MASSKNPIRAEGATEDTWVGPSERKNLEQRPALRRNASAVNADQVQHTLPLRFIDGLDKTYSTATRVHIARRQAGGNRKKRSSIRDPPPKAAEAGCNQGTSVADSTAIVPYLTAEHPNPITLLGQARTDPFNTLALSLTSTEQFYLDQYIGLSSIYNLSRRSRYHPPRDIIFPPSKGATPALLTMMAYAARGLANQTMSTVHEEHFLNFRAKAINAVRQELSDTKETPRDGLVIGVCGLLATELEMVPKIKPPDTEVYLSAHIQGLRAIMRSYGGFTKACMRPALNWLLHWEDLFTGGELSAGMTPLSPYVTQAPARLHLPLSPPEIPPILYPPATDFCSPAEELSGAYGAFFREAHNRRLEACSRIGSPREDPNRSVECVDSISAVPIGASRDPYMFFRPGTPIWRLLRDPSAWRTLPPVGPLLYLNMLLYENRGAAAMQSLSNDYLPRVCEDMALECLDRDGSVEVLMWVLMRDPNMNPRSILDPERVWTVTRMLRLLKKVDKMFRMRLESALYAFLRAGDPELALMPRMELECDIGGECEAKEPVWVPEIFRAALFVELGMVVDDVDPNTPQDDVNHGTVVGIVDEDQV